VEAIKLNENIGFSNVAFQWSMQCNVPRVSSQYQWLFYAVIISINLNMLSSLLQAWHGFALISSPCRIFHLYALLECADLWQRRRRKCPTGGMLFLQYFNPSFSYKRLPNRFHYSVDAFQCPAPRQTAVNPDGSIWESSTLECVKLSSRILEAWISELVPWQVLRAVRDAWTALTQWYILRELNEAEYIHVWFVRMF
jgi:hypothetical protein